MSSHMMAFYFITIIQLYTQRHSMFRHQPTLLLPLTNSSIFSSKDTQSHIIVRHVFLELELFQPLGAISSPPTRWYSSMKVSASSLKSVWMISKVLGLVGSSCPGVGSDENLSSVPKVIHADRDLGEGLAPAGTVRRGINLRNHTDAALMKCTRFGHRRRGWNDEY